MRQWRRLVVAVQKAARKNSGFRRTAWAVLFTALLAFVFSSGLAPERYDLEVGQTSPQQILAPSTVIDQIETQRLQQEAADEVKDVVELDARVVDEVLAEVKAAFTAVRQIRLMPPELDDPDGREAWGDPHLGTEGNNPDPEVANASMERIQQEALAAIKALEGLSSNERAVLLSVGIEDLARMEQLTTTTLRRTMDSGIKSDQLASFRRQIDTDIEASDTKASYKAVVSGIAQGLLRPNMVVNYESTMERKRRAMDNVEPVRVLEGDVIIDAGERVTDWHLAILRELGLERSQTSLRVPVGASLLALIVMGLVVLYVNLFDQRVRNEESLVILTGLIVLLTVTMIEVLKPISGFLPPVAAGTMLLATLVGPQLALFVGTLLGLCAGILVGYDIRFALAALAGGAVGVYSVVRIGQRSDLAKTGVVVAAANVAAVIVVTLLLGTGSTFRLAVWQDIGWAAASGVLAAVLTIGSLPFFENYFGIITSVKLLELSNPNQPLLRRLLVETPGTYHHSVMVANLAEAGVEAIGGNSLLARVGAYYHDIGKLKRPYFFAENQITGDNPHDKISPSLSVLILTSHVRDGVDLAREAKLPDAVIDYIREHHGTSLVSFFYSRAAENGQEQVPEHDFRYDGPRPRTRETALVMLADSCEAAVRSISRPTPGRIEAVVRKIIRDRLNDRQLDRCDLTLRELDIIADTFVRVLTGVFHPRIEYPDMVKDIQRREGGPVDGDGRSRTEGSEPPDDAGKGDGDNNQQPPG